MTGANFNRLNCAFALWLLNSAATVSALAADPTANPELFATNIHRVIFLGDSITYNGQYVGYIEAYFRSRHPTRPVEFVNLGLPSETVSGLSEPEHLTRHGFARPDLHERLTRILVQTKPDLVFACYAMNDGVYLPFEDGRFKKYQEGIRWLHEEVQAAGPEIILLTPPMFDEVKAGHPGYSAVLERYSEWLVAQRAAGWSVVDLHGPMKRELVEQRKRDPVFAFAKDGVHPNDSGHWFIAQQILLYLGAKDVAGMTNAVAVLSGNMHAEEVLKLVRQRQDVMKNAWLTATGHKRPMMPAGRPLAEAQKEAAELGNQIRRLLP